LTTSVATVERVAHGPTQQHKRATDSVPAEGSGVNHDLRPELCSGNTFEEK
jgi:hypothetical protein